MNKNFVSLIIIIVTITCFGFNSNYRLSNKLDLPVKIDTVSGYFLYEINVPFLCYSKFDAISQGGSLIYFNKNIQTDSMITLYKRGVFIYSVKYEDAVKSHIDFSQNKKDIYHFLKLMSPFLNDSNDSISKLLLYDKNNLLSYKKVYVKMAVINIGKTKRLIPRNYKYHCCYSNEIAEVQTYFIKDFIEVKLIDF